MEADSQTQTHDCHGGLGEGWSGSSVICVYESQRHTTL